MGGELTWVVDIGRQRETAGVHCYVHVSDQASTHGQETLGATGNNRKSTDVVAGIVPNHEPVLQRRVELVAVHRNDGLAKRVANVLELNALCLSNTLGCGVM